jgi:hypothetical protein
MIEEILIIFLPIIFQINGQNEIFSLSLILFNIYSMEKLF